MSVATRSIIHHWWPVGLQTYWADRRGDVYWIDPDERIGKKRAENRKIGYKRHGHTFSRGSVWEHNFEAVFDIDNEVHNIIGALKRMKPLGASPSEFFSLIKLVFKRDRTMRDACKFYHIEEKLHRDLLLLLHSLLIRSPRNRSRYENYPSIIGLPPDEEVGKANMIQDYRIAKKLCENGLISNQYFVVIQSPFKKFICGDGSLDWLTSGLGTNRINGRALVPLTPHICVYFCTPQSMRSTPNCAAINAAPWMVETINQITQIYSRDKLFFLGNPPVLTEAFRKRRFLEHIKKTDVFVDMLDEICGIRKDYRSWMFEKFD